MTKKKIIFCKYFYVLIKFYDKLKLRNSQNNPIIVRNHFTLTRCLKDIMKEYNSIKKLEVNPYVVAKNAQGDFHY